MTSNDRKELINTLIRLIDDDIVLTKWERRDMLERVCGKLGGWSMEKHIQNSGNNRKLKIKRGTNTENNEYRGVCGEITMDTDEKTIRLHDGETVGGVAMARADSVTDMGGADYVVAWQNPTAENNYTWFRKYKSGWVEQGGRWVGSIRLEPYNVGTDDITLPVVMSDGNYYAVIKCNQNNNINAMTGYGTRTNTATTLRIIFKEFLNSTTTIECADWYVCGIAAD